MVLPPTELVVEALRETVGPPCVASVLVVLVARFVFGKSIPFWVAVGAFIAALAVGNYFGKINPNWWPGSQRATWIHWLAACGAIAGGLTRRLPMAGLVLWGGVVAIATTRILAKDYYTAPFWAVPAFALLPGLLGFGHMTLNARRHGIESPLIFALALLTAGVVVIHAHSKSLLDVATLGGMSLLGLTLARLVMTFESGAALPGAAFLLVGTQFAGYHETYSKVPMVAFLLPAIAPAAVLLGLIPQIDRLPPRFRWPIILVPALVLLAVAVASAMSHESLSFEDY